MYIKNYEICDYLLDNNFVNIMYKDGHIINYLLNSIGGEQEKIVYIFQRGYDLSITKNIEKIIHKIHNVPNNGNILRLLLKLSDKCLETLNIKRTLYMTALNVLLTIIYDINKFEYMVDIYSSYWNNDYDPNTISILHIYKNINIYI